MHGRSGTSATVEFRLVEASAEGVGADAVPEWANPRQDDPEVAGSVRGEIEALLDRVAFTRHRAESITVGSES